MDRLDDAESIIAGLPGDDPEAIAVRTRIALDREDLDEADRLLALGRGDDPLLSRLRGRLALFRGGRQTLWPNFRTAYAADPENRDTIFGLIAALEFSGDKKAALALREYAGQLDRLSTLDPARGRFHGARQDAGLMRQLGAACAALDRKGEARAWYKLAIGFDPLDAESQQALFRLNDPRPTSSRKHRHQT